MLRSLGPSLLLAGCVFLTDADRERRVDADGDGFNVLDDCDDAVAGVFPGAAESCDGVDQDCDGEIDEGYYPDEDGDGFGDDTRLGEACFVDWITVGGDCRDDDALVKPGAPERCDGVDNGCVEGWTPEHELGVVTWVEEEGDTGFVDMSEAFSGDDANYVLLPDSGVVSICRGAVDYEVRMVHSVGPVGLSIEGVAIPMEGDGEDVAGRPVFNGAGLQGPLLAIDGDGWSATVSGLVLQGGDATEAQFGSGIHAVGAGSFVMDDLLVRAGEAPEGTEGGCVYLKSNDQVVLTDSVVNACYVESNGELGGAGMTILDSAQVGVYRTRFSANESADFGGAMWVSGVSVVDVADSTFEDNVGKKGGGAIYVLEGDLDLTGVTITSNSATNTDDQGGGGLYCGGACTCTDSTITGNSTSNLGGGARVETSAGRLWGYGCAVSGNTPDDIWADDAYTPADDTFFCDKDHCEDQ